MVGRWLYHICTVTGGLLAIRCWSNRAVIGGRYISHRQPGPLCHYLARCACQWADISKYTSVKWGKSLRSLFLNIGCIWYSFDNCRFLHLLGCGSSLLMFTYRNCVSRQLNDKLAVNIQSQQRHPISPSSLFSVELQ